MPRTAANRNFGFKSPGLVRILTAADPDEVLTALTILGIEVHSPELDEAFETLIAIGVGHFFKFLEPLSDLFEVVDSIDTVVQSIAELPTGRHYFEDEASRIEYDTERRLILDQSQRAAILALATKTEFEDLQTDFREQMATAKIKYADVTWPPAQGLYE